MCGIAGFTILEQDDPYTSVSQLHRMTGSLFHRGPNAEGLYLDERIALGSRRLSLVDISNGSQPFYNENRTVVVIYNGEIYNAPALRKMLANKGHKLYSACDGEIIPHLYEEYSTDFMSRLDGMFAIALWDTTCKRFILTVDQAGIKPLYYTQKEKRLIFASELKALFSIGGARPPIDPVSMLSYLKYKFIPAPCTPYTGIQKMMPGQTLVWEDNRLVADRGSIPIGHSDGGDLTELLETAIKTTTMSDKRVGCLLSGGLDSSIVAAVIANELPNAPIFGVGYPGRLEADETYFAAKLCKELGMDYCQVCVGPADVPANLDEIVWHLDEPNQDPITVPYFLLLRQVKESVSVVLTGDGSDEFFGGYQRFAVWDAESSSNLDAYGNELFLFRLEELRQDFTDAYRDAFERLASEQSFPQIHSLQSCMAWERQYRLPAYHLNRVDKLSMAWGVEARVPFLRPTVTNYALRLSAHELRNQQTEKVKLKEAFRGRLPAWLLERKKQPFTFPISHWLRTELQEWSKETLLYSASPVHAFVDRTYVACLIDQHHAAQADHSHKIWSLLVMDAYLKQN